MTLYYTDVSNNNWSSTAQLTGFLAQQAPEGFAGVAHKMSEGSYYIDPFGAQCQAWCAANGFPFIGYHYVTTDDPASQAKNWLAAAGGKVAMFDWEANSGNLANFWAVANAFNAVGVHVQIGYCPQWYWNQVGGGDLSAIPALVSSAYPGGSGYASTLYENGGGDTGEGWNAYGKATPSAWQFTSSANVAGFTVDANAYKGTDINVLFGLAVAPIVTPVSPAPPVVTPPPVVVPPPAPPVTPPVIPATTVEQLLAQLITELSASGSDSLPSEDPTQPNLTLRQAIKAILWKETTGLDLTDRPRDPTQKDDLLGHILSMRAEALITQALVTSLCEAANINVTNVIAGAKAAL